MSKLFKLIYHSIHTTGILADAAYDWAYRTKGLTRWWQDRKALRDGVTPQELYKLRDVAANSSLILGITNICNARCVFCAYPRAVDNKDLKGGVMPLPLFKKIIDEWRRLGGDTIDLTHTVGDPLIDPGIVEKINYAVASGIKKVTFTTNGILLNRNDCYRRLIDAGVSEIYISTSGTDKEDYEQTYGVKHYEDMISGVHNLLRYNREKGDPTFIGIRFRNSLKPSDIIRTRDFQEKIKPFFSDRVRCNFTIEFDNWGGLIRPEEMRGNMRLRESANQIPIPCKALMSFMIRYDGSVRLCGCRFKKTDMDEMVVGNVQHQSLLEISKSPQAWAIIEGFYSGKRPDSCVKCSFYSPVTRKDIISRSFIKQMHDRGEIVAKLGDNAFG